MLGEAGRVGDGADGEGGRRGEHVEAALVAARDGREHDARLALEALGAAVDERLEAVGVVAVDEVDEGGADPPARVDRVEAADDEVELHVVVVVLVLDLAVVAAGMRA